MILAAVFMLMDFGFYWFLSGLELVIWTGVLHVSSLIPSVLCGRSVSKTAVLFIKTSFA